MSSSLRILTHSSTRTDRERFRQVVYNPPNRFHSAYFEPEECRAEDPTNPEASAPMAASRAVKVYEEDARTILSKNDSPDLGFTFSVNPYRGCFHACAYCYARPTHQYLDFGAGSDFETHLIAKVNAAELLRQSFEAKRWDGEPVLFSGNTDCYQPLEAQYELTRRCLEVCLEYRNPVMIITKGALIRRDVELLASIARDCDLEVSVSIAFADDRVSRAMEPGAARPSHRFETIRILADAGIRVGVSLAPVIPGLNDHEIPSILERASAAGAQHAFMSLLRLPSEVAPVFTERLNHALPERASKVLSSVRRARGGKLSDSRFHSRMRGAGNEWQAVEWLFDESCRKAGLNVLERSTNHASTFRRPEKSMGAKPKPPTSSMDARQFALF